MLWAFLCFGALAADDPTMVVEGAHLSVDGQVEVEAKTLNLESITSGEALDVTATVTTPSMTISAARSTWDLQKRSAHFTGAVTAVQGDLTLKCDDLTVRYGVSDRVERAEATGNVQATRGAHRAVGQRAVLENDRVVLTGTPVLEDGQNRMTGQTIVFLEHTVECLECQMQIDSKALAPAP